MAKNQSKQFAIEWEPAFSWRTMALHFLLSKGRFSHTIHVWYIYLFMNGGFLWVINVGKYTVRPMDGMGLEPQLQQKQSNCEQSGPWHISFHFALPSFLDVIVFFLKTTFSQWNLRVFLHCCNVLYINMSAPALRLPQKQEQLVPVFWATKAKISRVTGSRNLCFNNSMMQKRSDESRLVKSSCKSTGFWMGFKF